MPRPLPSFPTISSLVLLAASRVLAATEPDPAEGLAFFETKIRPLLAERCFECHHPDKKMKGGLRLDLREGWTHGGDSGPALVPGHPDKSLLLEAVRYHNPKLQMPPKRRLTDAQVADLETWIALGAPDPRDGEIQPAGERPIDLESGRRFWSFQPIRRPEPPAVQDRHWPRTSIDHFTLADMEHAGRQPSPDASRETLARRAWFALTGLPPTPAQIDAFATDPADHDTAFAKLVDSLLDSPHYGERWGRHWLDLARFAESSGGGRTLLFKDAWRYRDYVIDSFNEDVPFDRFLREQIAGDLLASDDPAERRRQLVAPAFLALGPTNYEEQDKKQLRFDIIDEQLDTIGKSLLGMTIGCARCHDHKFDPIPQSDYYALAGILASTATLLDETSNVARWYEARLPLAGAQADALAAHQAEVAALEKEITTAKAAATKLLAATGPGPRTPGQPIAIALLPGIVVDDSEAKVVGEWQHSTHSKAYIGEGYLHDIDRGKGEKTLTFVPTIPTTGRYEVRIAYPAYPGRSTAVPVTIFHADGEAAIRVDMSAPPLIDGRFLSLGTYRFEKDGAGFVLVSNTGTTGHVNVDAVQLLPEANLADKDADDAPAAPDTSRAAAAQQHLKKLEAQLRKLKAEAPQQPVAMSVRDAKTIGDTEIRVRGLVHNRGESVPRGFLQIACDSAASPEFSKKESGRRELAAWIVSADNPLTARVLVNRFWGWLFGAGLVRTTDNFGTTGEPPSHPELLDHLASRFLEEGWSMKKLVREIVLSRTWQQSVGTPPADDPDNRLLSSFPRRRLDAEQIRDAILAVSGSLDLAVGGPNIAGAHAIDANTTAAQEIEYSYVFRDTRRSVYTPAFRNKRLELFEVFDFANVNQPIGRRETSTVAPQALFLLHSPFVTGQAEIAARRILAADAPDDAARLTLAFRTTLGRLPDDEERRVMMEFLQTAPDRDSPDEPLASWTHILQTLFGCLDFRYLD